MPNWCSTTITIYHDKVSELNKLIDEWTSKNYKANGFGLNWLGNIVGNSGIGTVDENPETDLRCRGSIVYRDCFDGELQIETETAWSPMLLMWKKLLDKYLPDAHMIYRAEECGCSLYCTNDEDLINRYVIDCWDYQEIESDWEAKESYVVEVLQKLLDTTETNVEQLMEMFEDSDHTDKLVIHKWDYAAVDEMI